ncbi:Fe2+/Zn2+ uptake regulation proteins [[Clostridium] ultunense Esp]|uniref:Fe2+/Zn2+ uptake regulation proteins n=1 Tax=[Clostridium] ultunense Esp TaxID=1288971 RepID=M1YVN6_9FIRM|nr:Fur family transcriptional regulator [Schnuerera ultunensis]CCQ94625.1 Fe2+/Zn2+ uptake regulation proteins [[Clostridium] ultunense Esp]SHD76702.1 Fe2+/Zn2+ uptake regulation proteins [[Clostridium] ultunense Esp]
MGYTNEMIIDYLKKHDIRPSTIRIKVLNYLLNNRIHPTVDDIYKNLIEDIPTLSKTSIYNTLDLFLEKGVVKVLALWEKELRYDIDTNLHGHFKCEKCGKVYDFPISSNILSQNKLEGFKINDKNIHLYGICKECNK